MVALRNDLATALFLSGGLPQHCVKLGQSECHRGGRDPKKKCITEFAGQTVNDRWRWQRAGGTLFVL